MNMSIDLRGTYYSVGDAADYLGVTPGRIRQMIRDGSLKSAKVSERAHLIRQADLNPHLKPSPIGRPRKNTNDNS